MSEKIKFGDYVEIVTQPRCSPIRRGAKPCPGCMNARGFWHDTGVNGESYPDGIFIFDKNDYELISCSGPKPENLRPIYKCKLKRKRNK